MRLYILRHGHAVNAAEAGGRDAARVLSAKGVEKTELAARGMLELGFAPDVIVTSPYPRAAQTAEITARVLGRPGSVVPDESLQPGAALEDFFPILEQHAAAAELMLVGHNPDLEFLIEALISAAGDVSIQMKKGAVAIVDLEIDTPMTTGRGTLVSLLTALQLSSIAD